MVDQRLAVGQEDKHDEQPDVITITMRKRVVIWFSPDYGFNWKSCWCKLFGECARIRIRAAVLSWIASAVLAAIGVVLWLRQGRSRRLGESNEQP